MFDGIKKHKNNMDTKFKQALSLKAFYKQQKGGLKKVKLILQYLSQLL